MTRVGILLAIFFAIAVLSFNNCSNNGFKVNDVLSSVSSTTVQCRQQIISSARALLFSDPTVCDTAANYQCDLRKFRAGLISGPAGLSRVCASVAGLGDTCVAVTTYNFDTREQQKTAEASQLVEGGAYNRDEAACINTQVVSQKVAVIQSEGASVAEALEKSIEQCRQRSRSQ